MFAFYFSEMTQKTFKNFFDTDLHDASMIKTVKCA